MLPTPRLLIKNMRFWRSSPLNLLLLPILLVGCGLLPDPGVRELANSAPTDPPKLATVPGSVATQPAPIGLSSTPASAESPAREAVSTSDVSRTVGSDADLLTTPTAILPGETAVPAKNPMVTSDQQASFEALANNEIPLRDDLELARLYRGWDGTLEAAPAKLEPLQVGTIQQLNILNRDAITISPITAELLAVGEHAYFWFDTGPGSFRPAEGALVKITATFDQIYEQSVAIFGSENIPGVDGDPRLHIVNASPLALCDVTLDTADQCGLAGYFSADDRVPVSVDPDSNAREMFVMNVDYFGSDFYLNVLTHELRHMIEDNYDHGDADWEAEGSAMLAEDLLGYPGNGITRANIFLSDPDRQLNSWPEENRYPAYGQGYLFNRYLYDRLGQELYRQFAASPERGLKAVDAIAQANDLDITGEGLWLDWLVALAIHGDEESPEHYRFGVSGLDPVTMTQVEQLPATYEETVHQYAADYYRLTGDDDIVIHFSGRALVPLLDTRAASGDSVWLSNRANYSHMHLTRDLDLTDVESATLNYSVYHDIETGYDFAYVFVSEDGRQTWQSLEGKQMQGPADDPSGSALAEHFYTGRSDYWRDESIDLTPFSGKQIALRFAYVTDLILTHAGIALDNITVPEIGFYDDAEIPDAGWVADGFERVSSDIPQQWHLQLITFPAGIPVIDSLILTPEQTLSRTLSLANSGREVILVIGASAPMTLEKAQYNLDIGY